MKRVIALGFFDGVHLAHGRLLETTRRLADKTGCSAAALTFDRTPGKDCALLTTLPERVRVMREAFHIDEVLCLRFDAETRDLPWQTFVEKLLVGRFDAAQLVCGYDFRCGKGGAGTAELLRTFCERNGIGFEIVPKTELDGITVSSAHIRSLLLSGDVKTARRFLGRPYRLTGVVTEGKQFGRTLGTPTANLRCEEALLLPGNGVYAVKAVIGGKEYHGVCNIGTRPTVNGEGVTVETWFPEFSGTLYNLPLSLDFYERLRGERRFDSPEALKEEILRNAAQAKAFFLSE